MLYLCSPKTKLCDENCLDCRIQIFTLKYGNHAYGLQSIPRRSAKQLTVFCLVMDGIPHYIIHNGLLTAKRYLNLLWTIIGHFLENMLLDLRRSYWHRLDGTSVHCTQEELQELTWMFEARGLGDLSFKISRSNTSSSSTSTFENTYIKHHVYQIPINTRDTSTGTGSLL